MSPRLSRRQFIERVSGAAVPLFAASRLDALAGGVQRGDRAARELSADLVIVGGGFGGCAAALAAAGAGLRVVMTEETDWIGGQLTAQAVPLDENAWIESSGGTASYRMLRQRIRDYYARNYPLTDAARANPRLNPGNGSVSRLCHEPRVGLAALEELLAVRVASGQVRILLEHRAVRADTARDRVAAVTVRSSRSGSELVLRAPLFVDATELGDLLPLTNTEFVTGAESRRVTGEPHAPDAAQPSNQQAFTCCFAMDYREGEDHTIDRPREYQFWKEYVPPLTPPWPGRLLSLVYSQPRTLKPFDMGFNPATSEGLFRYRRLVDRANFLPGTFAGDMTLVNWPQNDYMAGTLVGVPENAAARHVERAKQLSLSLLYWLQTECPRPDGGAGWKGLRLRPDVVGTEDGLAKYPYVRESRRIAAELTVLETHVATASRKKAAGAAASTAVSAEAFRDSVGIGSYAIDLHPTSGGNNYIDFEALPFQIPLGALIPRRVENLLPACKNIGTTHITNGCYRLHPVEWNIGEAVGHLAAFCRDKKEPPRAVRNRSGLLAEFQQRLTAAGIPLAWDESVRRERARP
jgi:hypothetical protein